MAWGAAIKPVKGVDGGVCKTAADDTRGSWCDRKEYDTVALKCDTDHGEGGVCCYCDDRRHVQTRPKHALAI